MNEYSVAFGCKLSQSDVRDYKIVSSNCGEELPKEFFRDPPRVKNQGGVSSCVAHATSSILEYHNKNELSTQFIYGIRRRLGSDYLGKGMYLKDACDICLNYGDMLEEDCKGNDEIIRCFSAAEKALDNKDKADRAYKNRIDSYYLCQSTDDIKYAIYKYGPVLAAIKWYSDFSFIGNDIMFNKSSDSGYHAIVIYGWDETGWLIQNSWGRSFGKNGRFHLGYSYNIEEARALIDHEEEDEALVKPNKLIKLFGPLLNLLFNFIKKRLGH